MIAETTAPTFTTKPALSLRTGTVNTTAVPLTLAWKATDSAALKHVRLTAPTAVTYGPTTNSAAHRQSGHSDHLVDDPTDRHHRRPCLPPVRHAVSRHASAGCAKRRSPSRPPRPTRPSRGERAGAAGPSRHNDHVSDITGKPYSCRFRYS